jgi:hypothetical protein
LKFSTRLVGVSLVAVSALAFSGCSADDDDDFVFTGGAEDGVIEVYAVDAPPELERLQSVVIRVQRVQVEGETGVGQNVTRTLFEAPAGTPLEVDLLALRGGRMDLIARDDVPPGDYDRVLLTLTGARVAYDVNGGSQIFSTEDGNLTLEQTEWQVDVSGGLLDVNPGDTDQVVLDFDLSQVVDVQGPADDPTGIIIRQSVLARPLFAESIRGVVRSDAGTPGDANDDPPLEGVIVGLFLNDQQVTTTKSDAQGVYALQSVPPGQYEVRVAEPGFASVDQPVSVNVGQQATADLTLQPQATPTATAGQ